MRLPLAGLRPVDVRVGIVTRKGRTLSPGATLLIERLVQEATALSGDLGDCAVDLPSA